MDDDRRLISVEQGLATLEARMDSRFDGISRQVNGLSDRLDDFVTQIYDHTTNHHGRASQIKQGGLAAAAATLLVTIAALLSKFFL